MPNRARSVIASDRLRHELRHEIDCCHHAPHRILRVAWIDVAPMHVKRVDRDEYEDIAAELSDSHETRDGGMVVVVGNHEDLGRTILRRTAGVFMVEGEDLSFVREWGDPMGERD